jgi:lysophospholipase L1-like esterase
VHVWGRSLNRSAGSEYPPRSWNPQRAALRQAVNEWLRNGGVFDAVIDFDRALRDPENPINMIPEFDCGDRLHPSDLGYRAMGDAIDLTLFD